MCNTCSVFIKICFRKNKIEFLINNLRSLFLQLYINCEVIVMLNPIFKYEYFLTQNFLKIICNGISLIYIYIYIYIYK